MEQVKISHIQQRRYASADTRRQVEHLLGWDDMTLFDYKHDCGVTYLHELMKEVPNGPMTVAGMERSKVYWNWWMNQWLLRDEVFVGDIDTMVRNGFALKRPSLTEMYHHLHNPMTLHKDIMPPSAVLDAIYEEIMAKRKEGICGY